MWVIVSAFNFSIELFNYIYELGVVERIGICQEDAIILKEALAPSFIN